MLYTIPTLHSKSTNYIMQSHEPVTLLYKAVHPGRYSVFSFTVQDQFGEPLKNCIEENDQEDFFKNNVLSLHFRRRIL